MQQNFLYDGDSITLQYTTRINQLIYLQDIYTDLLITMDTYFHMVIQGQIHVTFLFPEWKILFSMHRKCEYSTVILKYGSCAITLKKDIDLQCNTR